MMNVGTILKKYSNRLKEESRKNPRLPRPKKANRWMNAILIFLFIQFYEFFSLSHSWAWKLPDWIFPLLAALSLLLIGLAFHNPEYLDFGHRVHASEKEKLQEKLLPYTLAWLSLGVSLFMIFKILPGLK